MTRSTVLLLATVALLAPGVVASGCSSTASTGDVILAGTADTAVVMGDVGEAVFWEFPKFVVWTMPKALVYDFPRSAIIAIRGYRAKVEELIGSLDTGDLSLEEQVEVSGKLAELTGLPIRSTERWIEWWDEAKDQSERSWREEFILSAIDDLTSPDYFTRTTAIEDLKTLFDTTLGYDPKGTTEALEEGAQRWRTHLATNGLPPRKE